MSSVCICHGRQNPYCTAHAGYRIKRAEPKTIQSPEAVRASLLRLKDELSNRTLSNEGQEILFKINSCLFRTYPI